MIDQLTFDDLRAYQSGQLTGPARHRVERLLLENPFYADALAGLEAMQQTATHPTSEQLDDLRAALHERIHASANQKRLWPLWIATTTAAILFMLAMAIYFIFFAPKQPAKPIPKPTPTATRTALSMTALVRQSNAQRTEIAVIGFK
jgi:anti-sigma factor RsiW